MAINSKLSKVLSEAYISNLEKYENLDIEIINFDEIDKFDLKNKLLSLKQNSTVVLVQSTNFRIEDFRIRMSLHKAWVWCLEHNHLSYMKDNETENYIDAIEYKTPYYNELSNNLKDLSDIANSMEIVSKSWSNLKLEWGFEDMKQNTWDYTWKNRWWTFPIWENFTEIKDFSKFNWKVSIKAYPTTSFNVVFCEPFEIEIKESLIISYWDNTPQDFIDLLDMIKNSEDGEVYVRELGFWLNPNISWNKTLNDVNAYERMAWFHMSLWKKHWIYRKKFSRKITQRYHIDIFSDTDYIKIDDKVIYKNWKYVI